MIGDKLVITGYHRQSAEKVFARVKGDLKQGNGPLALSVAGESGSGKSEIAAEVARLSRSQGFEAVILQQDDYFVLPPHSNHQARLKDINWVGTGEVKLDLLDRHIAQVKAGTMEKITKPLVIYAEDRVIEETVDVTGTKIIIAEGTYTTLLKNVDIRVFINRNYRQTKKARLLRNREPGLDFLEKVLEIEHQVISRHKDMAHIILPPPEGEQLG